MQDITPTATPQELLHFWQDAGARRWFQHDATFDADFRERFLASHEAAARGELDHWLSSPEGALGLVLLLDQFPRNAFRGTARMYATDAKARAAADLALRAGFDRMVPEELRQFFHLPFMHSEQLEDLERCVALNGPIGGEPLRYAQHHRDIVARFGRFPHRNAILGRTNTPDEERFLADGGFAG